MADYKLEDGREITFNLKNIKIREWQALRVPAFSDEKDNETLAKVSGLTIDEIRDLSADDYNGLFFSALTKFQRPRANPNSDGGSSSV